MRRVRASVGRIVRFECHFQICSWLVFATVSVLTIVGSQESQHGTNHGASDESDGCTDGLTPRSCRLVNVFRHDIERLLQNEAILRFDNVEKA